MGAYAQTEQSLCLSLNYSMSVKLLTKRGSGLRLYDGSDLKLKSVGCLLIFHLDFLSFKGGCTDSSESTLVKLPYFWKSHVAVYLSEANKSTWRRICLKHVHV